MTRLEELSKTPEPPANGQREARMAPGASDCYEALLSSVAPLEHGGLRERRAVGIVSCFTGDGSSTVAYNLAACAAAVRDGRVLLVDANQSNPMLHRLFRLQASPGLETFLAGDRELAGCVQPTQADNLSVMATGIAKRRWFGRPHRRSPAELLAEAAREFALTIVDLPPLAKWRANTGLASVLDAVVLVVEAGRARLRDVEQAKETLAKARVQVCGVVLNKDRRATARRVSSNGKHTNGHRVGRFQDGVQH